MAGIVEKIKGFLFSPSETFDASKEDTLGDAFKYYLILLPIPALLLAVIFTLLPLPTWFPRMPAPLAVVFFAVVIYVGNVIVVIINSLWLHI